MVTTIAEFKGGMKFDVELLGHTIRMDADEEFGGEDYGPAPKPFVLSALAGCTGMDVVAILGKMQMPYDSFRIEVDGETTDEHPKVYKTIRLRYIFTGADLDESKINKAVKLSQDKYCGVSAMLKQVAEVSYEVILN